MGRRTARQAALVPAARAGGANQSLGSVSLAVPRHERPMPQVLRELARLTTHAVCDGCLERIEFDTDGDGQLVVYEPNNGWRVHECSAERETD